MENVERGNCKERYKISHESNINLPNIRSFTYISLKINMI